jgi:predicted TPR repeat methyltransferase
MLTEAKQKGVYDELEKGELTEYLRAHRDAFDLIVSADTLVYFGRLDEVMAAVSAALRPNGQVIFTLEEATATNGAGGADGAAEAATAAQGFVLRAHGRYCHTQSYVETALTRAGLSPSVVHAELRMEAGSPVAGLAIRATRRDGEHHA